MEIIVLYIFFTGCVYAPFLWDEKAPLGFNVTRIIFGFLYGWLVTPILIGMVIKQVYKDESEV